MSLQEGNPNSAASSCLSGPLIFTPRIFQQFGAHVCGWFLQLRGGIKESKFIYFLFALSQMLQHHLYIHTNMYANGCNRHYAQENFNIDSFNFVFVYSCRGFYNLFAGFKTFSLIITLSNNFYSENITQMPEELVKILTRFLQILVCELTLAKFVFSIF